MDCYSNNTPSKDKMNGEKENETTVVRPESYLEDEGITLYRPDK